MPEAPAIATHWRPGDRRLELDRPRLMGIVNVTPDSFSDGGALSTVEDAVAHGLSLVAAGADVLDVGGESTRPGAARVEVAEQIERTAPVIAGLRARSDVPISIDTTRAAVARAALDAGADAVNDVAAGTEDEAMLDLAAERGCGLVLMHRRVAPPDDVSSEHRADDPTEPDVTATVRAFLAERLAAARAAGVADETVLLDPGLGFGKTVGENYRLVAETGRLLDLGRPLLAAASRKSFIGAVTGERDPARRVAGSVALSVVQFGKGIRIFRVHDVAEHRAALAVAAAAAG